MTTFMADSIEPLKIPLIYRAARNHGVALYVNGRYAVNQETEELFPRHITIGVYSGVPDQGLYCDAIDTEKFDATADDWPPFRKVRDEWCVRNNSNRWPKVYCSIDPGGNEGVADIVRACRDAGQELPQHWWIAWYPQTGSAPTLDQVHQAVERNAGVNIDPATIWGVQWTAGQTYDRSVIFQNPRWA